MRATLYTVGGSSTQPSEDWVHASSNLAFVLDGGTVRTETGCVHGVPWYVQQLGGVIAAAAASEASLSECLARAIGDVNALHPQCDLSHPGTPSAAAGVVRTRGERLEYLVLGDIMILIETPTGITAITDQRVSQTAQPARRQAELLPIGSAEKAAALLEMKAGELAARNTSGGYWVAASDPAATAEAITGEVDASGVSQVAILSDGAARLSEDFQLLDRAGTLKALSSSGPAELVQRVREAEASDPLGLRWPRNKVSDDATVIHIDNRPLSPSERAECTS